MKKLVSIALALSLVFSAVPVMASSTTNNTDESVYITEKYSVKQETTLPLTDVPALVIKSNKAYIQDFSFQLELTGASFTTYADTGILAGTNSGVTYIKIGDDRLRITVDSTKFNLTTKDLEIPLYTTLSSEGDITVTIDPKDSPLPASVLTFANLSDKKYILDVNTVNPLQQEGALGDIIIRDKSPDVVESGTILTLELDNGFTFGGAGTVTGTGKFKDCVTFEFDKGHPNKATVTVKKRTDNFSGTIVLSGVNVIPDSKTSVLGSVYISLDWKNDNTKSKVANYIAKVSYNQVITVDKFAGGYKPSASGTAAPEKMLQIRIDDDDYGNLKIEKDGTWDYVFPYEFSNLKPGTHKFAVGYYQEDVDYFFDAIERDFEIAPEKTTTTVIFAVDSTSYSFGDKPGFLDAPAYIDANGRTMLPLRAVSATLGVPTENVKWDADTQTVTVTKGDKTIVCEIGKQELVVNGKIQKLDTAATIVNGRTFLPLRPLLNALGISDDNIKWDASAKVVTFEV